jgi:hypothetical protein
MMPRTILSTLALIGVLSIGAVQAQTSETASAVLTRVTIPQDVLANGQPLAAGKYDVRLAEEWPDPLDPGDTQGTQRVEFYAGGRLAGRDTALVIPASEIGAISEWHPAPGATRVDALKSGDFVRIWVNRDGTNYLIHLPTGATSTPR